jgi:hypothetical protein
VQPLLLLLVDAMHQHQYGLQTQPFILKKAHPLRQPSLCGDVALANTN